MPQRVSLHSSIDADAGKISEQIHVSALLASAKQVVARHHSAYTHLGLKNGVWWM